MTSTQLPTPHDAVTHVLSTIAMMMPDTTMAQRYDYARRSVLTSIVNDAQTNAARRVRYYADQLDQLDRLNSRWDTAGNAAELCDDVDHFVQFSDSFSATCGGPVAPDLQAIDNHIRAHLPHNTPES